MLKSIGANVSIVSAVPEGDVIARDEVFGIVNPSAATIVKFAKKYFQPPNENEFDWDLHVQELGRIRFDLLNDYGCLPPACKALEELSFANLERAFERYEDVTNDPDKCQRLMEKTYGASSAVNE